MVDERIQAYYTEQFDEARRLTTRSAQGRLEFERVQELVRAQLPAGARILDVGGATGIHAAALAADGHEVVLLDPVPAHVAAAKAYGTFEALDGDARALPFGDREFDAVLLFGPLYHLETRDERLLALREAARVTRIGGTVFAQAIPRHVAHAAMTIEREIPRPYPNELVALLEDGIPPLSFTRFPGAHFHTATSLASELADAGLTDVTVAGIEGPAGLALEQLPGVAEDVHQAALILARAVQYLPGVRDLSNHLIGSGVVASAHG